MTRYEDRSKEELLQLAAEHDVEGRSSMSKAELIAALRGDSDATVAPSLAPHAPKKLDLHGIFDNDAKQISHYFDQGTASEQRDAAQNQIDRLLEHVGEAQSRDLRVVAISEA